MPVYKVHVKWGKEKFKNIECSLDEPPIVFKAQLFALSGVQPERQKVMVKGGVVKDDAWGDIKLRDGMTLLMMGSADELPEVPTETEQTLFMEDMTEQELASALEMPAGLSNLGNTCYMNATLQCLRTVPELKDALKKYKGNIAAGNLQPDQSITCAFRDLFVMMDQISTSIPPIIFLNILHMFFPQFAEKNEQGEFSQQDANEFWTEMVRCLQRELVMPEDDGSAGQGAVGYQKSFIDRFFAGQFAITMKCVESEEEPIAKSTETYYQLSCFIQKEVKYLHTGLKSRLQEHITKHSPVLSRDAQYLKSCKISRLPAYLTVQMVRFFYKEKEGVNAKILKDIKFPMSLDVYDLCTEEVQKKLLPMRDRLKKNDELQAELLAKKKELELAKTEKEKKEEEEEEEPIMFREPYSFPDDVGSNNSGYYELQAVLTHKGRSSTSGHYVGWARKKGDEWVMFDDDRVTPVTASDVKRLSGGGDWHCAYVLLYGPKILEREATPEEIQAMEEAGVEMKTEVSGK